MILGETHSPLLGRLKLLYNDPAAPVLYVEDGDGSGDPQDPPQDNTAELEAKVAELEQKLADKEAELENTKTKVSSFIFGLYTLLDSVVPNFSIEVPADTSVNQLDSILAKVSNLKESIARGLIKALGGTKKSKSTFNSRRKNSNERTST